MLTRDNIGKSVLSRQSCLLQTLSDAERGIDVDRMLW